MITNRQKQEMLGYLEAHLAGSSDKIEARSKELVPGIKSNYILVGDDGIVFLIDQPYANDTFKRIYDTIAQNPDESKRRKNFAPVFFKDGKTFFRSAVGNVEETGIKSKRFKADDEHSLKNYKEVMNQIISMRPEELFISRNLGKWIQYYQSQSEKLEQGIVSYKFQPVELDYSHIPPEERFGPITRISERLSLWRDKRFFSGNLNLFNNYLVPRKC